MNKTFKRIFSLLLVVLLTTSLVGCFGTEKKPSETPDDTPSVTPPDKKKTIRANVSHELREYNDEESEELGSHPKINVGKRYKLVLTYEFTNLEEIIGDSFVSLNIKVTLGELDNETNQKHWEEIQIESGKGLSYSYLGDKWVTNAIIDKDYTAINNAEDTFFIIGTDEMPTNPFISNGILVEIDFNDYDVIINNSNNKYGVTLTVEKGLINFTNDNITFLPEVGLIRVKNEITGVVEVIVRSGEIEYGIKKFEFLEDEIEINLQDITTELLLKSDPGLSTSDISEILREWTFTITIVAVGGMNYNDSKITKTIDFSEWLNS